MNNFPSVVLTMMVFLLAGGCAHNSVLETNPNFGRFAGLNVGLEASKRLNLVVVHGMGTHPAGYSDSWVARVAGRLGLGADTGFDPKTIHILRRDGKGLAGFLKVSQFATRSPSSSVRGKLLRVYEITWSPTTESLKRTAFKYDDEYKVPRASFNRALKRDLMNDSFGDAVLYIGTQAMKDAIQYPVEQALCIVTNDSALDNAKDGAGAAFCEFAPHLDKDFGFAVLTHSLGSAILFDVMQRLTEGQSTSLGGEDSQQSTENAKATVKEFENGIYHVFMMANQIPLIQLAANKICDDDRKLGSLSSSLGNFLARLGSYLPPIERRLRTIVAFNDPNDLLSYPISECVRRTNPQFHFVDIEISIAKWALYIPGGGMAANPLTAHLGYPENQKLIDLISCGGENHSCR